MQAIAILPELSEFSMKALPSAKVQVIIYLKMRPDFDVNKYAHLRFIDTTSDVREAIALGYYDIRMKLRKINKMIPGLMNCMGYDFMAALNKDIFWTLFDDYLIQHTLFKLKKESGGIKYKVIDRRKRSKGKERLKILTRDLKKVLRYSEGKNALCTANAVRKKIAIKIDSLELLAMLGVLPEKAGYENILAYSLKPMNEKLLVRLQELGIKTLDLSGSTGSIQYLSFLHRTKLALHFDSKFVNVVASVYEKLTGIINQYTLLAQTGVRNILINAGENDGEGNILSQVARKYDIRSLNFMNGTKAYDACNEDTDFDYWFMHNEFMQKKVHETYGVPINKLPVTGHLLKDVAIKHSFSGLLNEWIEKYKPEFIIAYFSSPLYNEEKKLLSNYFLQFLSQNTKAVVFQKSHPREMADNTQGLHERFISLPKLGGEKERLQMFDMLSVSHFAVSIASTVAYQATWFSIPSVTFELRSVSRMSFVDGQTAFHCETIDQLDVLVNKSAKAGGQIYKGNVTEKKNAADEIIKHFK